MKTRSERSAGGVVFRRTEDGIDIALAARRTRRGELAWGLPKGLIEPDEQPEEAALREGHIGLASTIQRMQAIGGDGEVSSPGGKGTVVRASIPIGSG